jgi:hypothetical protein
MRTIPLLPLTLAGALRACSSADEPTQPEAPATPAPAGAALSAAPNSWTPTAPTPFGPDIFGYDVGAAPDAAGRWVAYTFGGTSDEEGGTGRQVQAYDAESDTWTRKASQVGVYNSNGVAKLGNRLYFSGGYNEVATPPSFTNLVWAYDYGRDRMLRVADLPIYGAEGVTGVIGGKLYVLPGTCSGERYPMPGYCAEEPTRRFYRYDPLANAWTARRAAPHFHRKGAAAVIDGKLYVAGGVDASGRGMSDLDVYDPATNAWRTLAPLPVGGAASGGALQGQFFVAVQGFDGTASVTRFYAYNRSNGGWRLRAAPDRFGPAARLTLDGVPRLFMAGADHGALYTP